MSFKKGRETFENHGKVWHYDHIIPIAKFDLSKKTEQLRCFNYKNLQPLFIKDNLEKGDNYKFNVVLEIDLFFEAVKSLKL